MDLVQLAQAAAPWGQIGALVLCVALFLRAQREEGERRAKSDERLGSSLDGIRDALSEACAYRAQQRAAR